MKNIKNYIPGLVLVLIISLLSFFLNQSIKFINLEALTIAIIIGMFYNNTVGTQARFKPGISLSLKNILKLGIILMGFRIDSHVLLKLGPRFLILVVFYVLIALMISNLLGRFFNLNTRLATLIGIGSCICGASAVLAVAPCIRANDKDSVLAVSIVSFLGAIGVIVYSAIAVSGFVMTPVQYGTWAGLSLHGVAHAIAAAYAKGSESGEIGTFVKMTRVMMLVPVSLALSFVYNKRDGNVEKAKFPMYVLYFLIAGIVNSLGILPQSISHIFASAGSLFVLMAMTAMGLSVHFSQIKQGMGALMTGVLVFVVLSISSLFVVLHLV